MNINNFVYKDEIKNDDFKNLIIKKLYEKNKRENEAYNYST